MEKPLDKVLEDIVNVNKVSGCVVSDKQGLCLGCNDHTNYPAEIKSRSFGVLIKHVVLLDGKGTASPESSGLITALSECAKKLHPDESTPTIVLENNEKQCLIQSNDKLIVSIYKNIAA